MENLYYCPICGCKLNSAFTIGEICPCCGNESECDDHIENSIDFTIYSKEKAWEILRNKWINEGCPWVFRGKPTDWNKNMAKKQLKNINIYI